MKFKVHAFLLFVSFFVSASLGCSKETPKQQEVVVTTRPIMANIEMTKPVSPPTVDVVHPDSNVPMDSDNLTADEIIRDAPSYIERWHGYDSADAKAMLQMALFEMEIPAEKLELTPEDVKELKADYVYTDNAP